MDDKRLRGGEGEAAKGALPVRETVEKGHGRIEIRRCILAAGLDWLGQKTEWAGLSTLGRVESVRIIGDKTTTDHRDYLCSFNDLERFAEAARGHWAIENSLRRRKRLASLNDGYRSRLIFGEPGT